MSANSLHPRSAVERLYLPHRLGSRGLVGVEIFTTVVLLCYQIICKHLMMFLLRCAYFWMFFAV